MGSRGPERRRQRAGVEVEAKLVSRVDGGQDDSARRAARDVEARRFNGCRGQGESCRLRVAAAGGRGNHHEGRARRDPAPQQPGSADAMAAQVPLSAGRRVPGHQRGAVPVAPIAGAAAQEPVRGRRR